jgi:hypothetical protein
MRPRVRTLASKNREMGADNPVDSGCVAKRRERETLQLLKILNLFLSGALNRATV